MELLFCLLLVCIVCLFAAFLLLLAGIIYYECTNSEIPAGVDQPFKLRVLQMQFIGIAVVGRILENLGIWNQLGFTRYIRDQLFVNRLKGDSKLSIKDSQFNQIPVRIYHPKAPAACRRRGVIFFHGGGWMFGSLNSYDTLCRYIAKQSDSVVVSVQYRLAPEFRYPAQFEDCLNTAVYVIQNAEHLGIDASSIVICGDSAGGNLTAAVCQKLAQRNDLLPVCAQVLIYPALQAVDFNLPSYQQNRDIPILFQTRSLFYHLHYLNGEIEFLEDMLEGNHVPAEMKLKFKKWIDPDKIPEEFKVRGYNPKIITSHTDDAYEVLQQALEPTFSPLLAENDIIRKLPQTYILTCEYDVLRDDGILYKKRLEDNGVQVTWYHSTDGFHGIISFFDCRCLTFPSGKKALDNIVHFIKTTKSSSKEL
ncbi:arylacetamide deacetylase-like 4 [Protopterus annectens]|uniref:arylacetamide deacetylase-like 4 n=1 Tax=Protopterus annectens TaxID=7888 RepID=UPI001CFAC6A4|nr:arylacetamide deacetylase-like 4 [Protopterus annectens]